MIAHLTLDRAPLLYGTPRVFGEQAPSDPAGGIGTAGKWRSDRSAAKGRGGSRTDSNPGWGMVSIEERGGGVRFPVVAQPRASRSEIIGEHGEAVRIRLAAPPVEGKANQELIRLLADVLGVPKAAVRIVAGASARSKIVEVSGVHADAVRTALRIRGY